MDQKERRQEKVEKRRQVKKEKFKEIKELRRFGKVTKLGGRQSQLGKEENRRGSSRKVTPMEENQQVVKTNLRKKICRDT